MVEIRDLLVVECVSTLNDIKDEQGNNSGEVTRVYCLGQPIIITEIKDGVGDDYDELSEPPRT